MKRTGGFKVLKPLSSSRSAPKYPPSTRVVPHTSHLLISTGIRALDKFLGGGLPCCTVASFQMPSRMSSFCSPLPRYFASEGVVCGHSVLFLGCGAPSCSDVDDRIRDELLCFDYSAHLETLEEKKQQQETTGIDDPSAAAVVDSLEERLDSAFGDLESLTPSTTRSHERIQGDIEDIADAGKPELNIAFRYRDYVERQRDRERMREMRAREAIRRPTKSASLGTVPCHRFDLSKGLQPEIFQEKKDSRIRFVSVSVTSSNGDDTDDYFDQMVQAVEFLSQSNSVVRIVVLPEALRSLDRRTRRRDLVIELMARLKDLAHHSLSVALVCVPEDISLREARTSRCADVVFGMRSFAADLLDDGNDETSTSAELREWDGLFEILRLPKTNSLAARHRPEHLSYVFRLGKRKLTIEVLRLNPEVDGSRV